MSLLANHGLMIRDGGGTSPYLDGLPVQPRAVLSLRKLISTATLSVRVRRSSDNAEQDIGFSGDGLNVAALLAFVGAGSGYVRTWYDQTGNGEDAIQTVGSGQPRIVNAGAYDDAVVFDGINHALFISELNIGTPYFGLYLKNTFPDDSSTRIQYELTSNYNNFSGSFVAYMESNQINVGIRGGASYRRTFNPTNVTTLTQMTMLCQAAVTDATTQQQRLWVSGVPQSPAAAFGTVVTPVVNFTTTHNFYIGARNQTDFKSAFRAESIVVYRDESDSIRPEIEAIVG